MKQTGQQKGTGLEYDKKAQSAACKKARAKRFAVVAGRADSSVTNILEAADQHLDYEGGDTAFEISDATPTDARQGTREKLEELASRIANGKELWHPDDGGHDEDDDCDASGSGGSGPVTAHRSFRHLSDPA